MKTSTPLLALVALLCASCDENNSSTQTQPTPECTANVCKNDRTLNKCIQNHFVEQDCLEDQICSINACINPVLSNEDCTADSCKDDNTLKKCFKNKVFEVTCMNGQICQNNACVPQSSTPQTPSTQTCTEDICKDAFTLKLCKSGSYVEQSCGDNRVCEVDHCVDADSGEIVDNSCTVGRCLEDETTKYQICQGGQYVDATCPGGLICEGGGCMEPFELKSPCTDPDGYGKCTADGKNAIVCHNHKITRYTCAEPCTDGSNGIVNCPKKASPDPGTQDCVASEYTPTCINNNDNALVCVNGKVQTWNCYNKICSVDNNNRVNCPANAAIAGLAGIESGGTIGDECNQVKYQPSCVDSIYALTCKNGEVQLFSCDVCQVNTSGLVCENYAPCDPNVDTQPQCINNNQAIAYCTFDYVIEVSRCENCSSDPAKIRQCMLE